jgi:hypothetical protein
MSQWLWTRSRKRAYGASGIALLALISLMMWPDAAWLQAAGKPTPGHEDLQCTACHVPAEGTLRQQIQASLRFLLGLRANPAPIGNAPVTNESCFGCHDRPTERHPLSELGHLRYKHAQEKHNVENCTGCHQEHHGVRITAPQTICSNCHSTSVVENDPITPNHATLFAKNEWDNCVRCHDFHGNHSMASGDYDYPTTLEEGVTRKAVNDYYGAGKRAYGPTLHTAKKASTRR